MTQQVRSLMADDTSKTYTRLGAGSFATVFTCSAWANIVVKQVADDSRTHELRAEFETFQSIVTLWNSVGGECLFHLPRCLTHHSSFDAFCNSVGIPQNHALPEFVSQYAVTPRNVYGLCHLGFLPLSGKLSGQLTTRTSPHHSWHAFTLESDLEACPQPVGSSTTTTTH